MVSPTPDQPLPVCTHERRPGTTVCLHCRHDARAAAREKRKRLLLRGSAGAIVVATFLAAGALSATALRGLGGRDTSPAAAERPPHAAAHSDGSLPPAAKPESVAQQGVVPAPHTPTPSVATAAPNVSVAPAHAAAPAPPFGPVIDQGEIQIVPGVFAVRTDSAVSVFFDNPERRTRIPAKFEAFVRETLPKIFGSAADSALVSLKHGAIESQNDLLTELPIRGLHIPINPGWEMTIYPSTRPGRDGPLVIRYRVAVMPKRVDY